MHLPKTAGSSFAQSLALHFGNTLRLDYGDLPINTPGLRRNARAAYDCLMNRFRAFPQIQCIHGHFLPLKYWGLASKTGSSFITWVRDPVERLASHYYFWQKTYNPRTSPPLHKRAIEEQWSLERFCLGPELRNFYHQFFWGFSVSHFAFIGVTEYFAEDFRYFTERFFGSTMPTPHVNVNADKERDIYIENPRLRTKIETYHQADMRLYRQAVAQRITRSAHL
ncbi:MAG: hypothetical protein AB7G75_13100 [Candidatus Binatia bacterium]